MWPYHEFYCDPQCGGMSVGSGRAAMPLAFSPSLLIPPWLRGGAVAVAARKLLAARAAFLV